MGIQIKNEALWTIARLKRCHLGEGFHEWAHHMSRNAPKVSNEENYIGHHLWFRDGGDMLTRGKNVPNNKLIVNFPSSIDVQTSWLLYAEMHICLQWCYGDVIVYDKIYNASHLSTQTHPQVVIRNLMYKCLCRLDKVEISIIDAHAAVNFYITTAVQESVHCKSRR